MKPGRARRKQHASDRAKRRRAEGPTERWIKSEAAKLELPVCPRGRESGDRCETYGLMSGGIQAAVGEHRLDECVRCHRRVQLAPSSR